MSRDRSFKEYIADRFYSEFSDAVVDYIGDDIDKAELFLCRVRNVGEWEISDIDVKFVSVSDLPGMAVQFDAVIDAEFYVCEADHHKDVEEETHQQFILGCVGNLTDHLNSLQITNVSVSHIRTNSTAPLSDSLVPIIHSEDMERVAADFLHRYYPEALAKPTYVDPEMLARRMGLQIKLQQLTEDFSVFGQLIFSDTCTELYDRAAGCMRASEVQGGTILVDPQNFFMRNFGSVNNTIVHECVHWDKHRKAFELERLYNASATQIQCRVVGGIKNNSARSATDWMEWQANTLAPKIQMPLEPFKQKAIELIRRYRREYDTDELIDVLEPVIDELASFFVVSRLAAKIRMVDAGYDEAIGIFTYIDGHYVKPHRFKKNAIKKNQTYSIRARDAVIESVFSPQLSQKVQSGAYMFVDSHFCLNQPKYIQQGADGEPELTKYARCHMDECCLAFDLEIKSENGYSRQFFTECVLYRDAASNITFIPHYSNEGNKNDTEQLKAYNADIMSVLAKLPMSFSGSLDALIKWAGMKEEDLAEASALSEKTIQRLRNDEPNAVTLETVIQLCIGLKLPPQLSGRLVTASGNAFLPTEKHLLYQFLLNACYTYSIDACNDILTGQDFPPLGRQKKE